MNIEPPAINSKTESEQIQELKRYLFRLAQILNFTFQDIETRMTEIEKNTNAGGKK